jgi:hypothetical protein
MAFMPTDSILATTSIVTAAATVVFVVLAWISARQVINQLRRDSYQDISDSMADVTKLFIAYPEMRAYFYDGKKVGAGDDSVLIDRIRAMAEFFTDFMDNMVAQKEFIPPSAWQSWEHFIVYIYQNSPELCNYLDKHSYWYAPQLVTFARNARNQAKQEIQEKAPPQMVSKPPDSGPDKP